MTSSNIPSPPHPAAASPSPRLRWVAVLGPLLVIACALFAALQIQVLNPMATVPESSLAEIHAAVGRTADTMGWGIMIATLLPGPILAVLLALAGLRGRISIYGVVLGMLGLLVGASPIYLIASFPAGMTLADTFGVGGADHAPWAMILHVLSMLSLVALAVIAFVHVLRREMRATRDGGATAGA